ncbi:hypothetical protein ACP70R_031942 [Stipagrostis hirtigluma subsp. patula]
MSVAKGMCCCHGRVGVDQQRELPGELVSAVDVHHNGAPLLSRILETSTSSSWSPFCVDAVECNKPIGRAVPPASQLGRPGSPRRPVAVDRHWYTGETLVRYAVVLGGCKFEATVTWSEETGHISLTVEDAAVTGQGSLRLLAAAMAGPRNGGEKEAAAAKGRYEEFVRSKRGRKESKAMLVDLCRSAIRAVALLSFAAAFLLR